MKILHAASMLKPPSGIVNQMNWERKAAMELGIDWSVKIFCPKNAVNDECLAVFSSFIDANDKISFLHKVYKWFVLRIEYNCWLMKILNQYDVIVLRYYVHDPFQLLFVCFSNKPVLFVHHTLEVPELAMEGGLLGKLRASLELLIGKVTLKKAAGSIGVTSEILSYELNRYGQQNKYSFLYPNGILFDNKELDDKRTNTPEFIFVASFFYSWHGLDLLLDAIENNDSNFILHLVGRLSNNDYSRAARDPRIILHGELQYQEIRDIASSCWLGISSLALFRNKMNEACTLKVREYLTMGLPVYASYKEVFPDSFIHFKQGNVDINEIIDYSLQQLVYSRQSIADESRIYIDKNILLADLHNNILNVINVKS